MARETAIMVGLDMAQKRDSGVYVLFAGGEYRLALHCDGAAREVVAIVGPSGIVWTAQ